MFDVIMKGASILLHVVFAYLYRIFMKRPRQSLFCCNAVCSHVGTSA